MRTFHFAPCLSLFKKWNEFLRMIWFHFTRRNWCCSHVWPYSMTSVLNSCRVHSFIMNGQTFQEFSSLHPFQFLKFSRSWWKIHFNMLTRGCLVTSEWKLDHTSHSARHFTFQSRCQSQVLFLHERSIEPWALQIHGAPQTRNSSRSQSL